jgi:predicted CXXCH cytochrome family protein
MQIKEARRYLMINFARATIFSLITVFALFWPGGMSFVQADQNKVNDMLYLKKAKYVGMDTCVMCHEDEYRQFKLSTHYRIFVKSDATGAEGCEVCHGPGSVHVDASGGKGNIINPGRDPEICFTCHTDKKMQFRLPYHHPVLEGKMSCTDCHDPHGIDVKPWTATSEDAVNEVCFKCHADKRGPYIWKHDALKEGCTTCHQVHGSVNDKMLIARDYNLCLRCHAMNNYPYGHGQNGQFHDWTSAGACWSAGCHAEPHGSNFDHYFRY